jgi:hypothetical protein
VVLACWTTPAPPERPALDRDPGASLSIGPAGRHQDNAQAIADIEEMLGSGGTVEAESAMTERKPPDLSFTSWIDRQINEAAERGAFDNLPGAGKPLPKRTGADAAQAWLQDYLRREGVSADELLPTPLKLRKETERLAETVQDLGSEQEVRAVVADINRRIIEWRRIPTGPPVFLPLLDAESLVGRWHDAHPDPPRPPLPSPAPTPAPPTRRWRRRRS